MVAVSDKAELSIVRYTSSNKANVFGFNLALFRLLNAADSTI